MHRTPFCVRCIIAPIDPPKCALTSPNSLNSFPLRTYAKPNFTFPSHAVVSAPASGGPPPSCDGRAGGGPYTRRRRLRTDLKIGHYTRKRRARARSPRRSGRAGVTVPRSHSFEVHSGCRRERMPDSLHILIRTNATCARRGRVRRFPGRYNRE
jgi:hypothetical protein